MGVHSAGEVCYLRLPCFCCRCRSLDCFDTV